MLLGCTIARRIHDMKWMKRVFSYSGTGIVLLAGKRRADFIGEKSAFLSREEQTFDVKIRVFFHQKIYLPDEGLRSF